jgi:DnaK suppressor protein
MAKKKTTKKKAAVKKTAKKTARKTTAKKAVKKKAAPKKTAKKKVVKKKTAAKKKAVKKKAAPKKTARKKVVKKKTAAKKAVKKKAAPKKTAKKKTPAKKTVQKKTPAKKTPPKKTSETAPVVAAPKRKLTRRERKLQAIRPILLQQKEELLNEAEMAMNALPEPSVFPDLGDQASAETDRSFMLRLRGREQRLLNKIDEAMERLDAGSFGICDSCGEEIGIGRLKARPVATLCIHCKEEQEEEEKYQGG